MGNNSNLKIGSITWTDLTVPNAVEVRDFYSEVVGWKAEPFSMGDYDDFIMNMPDGKTAAGICHLKGVNKSFPSQWLIYITVENLDESIRKCREKGGKIIIETKDMGTDGRYCIIEDPAGAVAALFEQS